MTMYVDYCCMQGREWAVDILVTVSVVVSIGVHGLVMLSMVTPAHISYQNTANPSLRNQKIFQSVWWNNISSHWTENSLWHKGLCLLQAFTEEGNTTESQNKSVGLRVKTLSCNMTVTVKSESAAPGRRGFKQSFKLTYDEGRQTIRRMGRKISKLDPADLDAQTLTKIGTFLVGFTIAFYSVQILLMLLPIVYPAFMSIKILQV